MPTFGDRITALTQEHRARLRCRHHPQSGDIDLNIAALYYTYPGHDFDDLDYYEVRTSAAHTFDKWTLSIGNWWSPDNFNACTQSDAIEGGVSYALPGKWWNFFTPSISGEFGYQWYEKEKSAAITCIGMPA